MRPTRPTPAQIARASRGARSRAADLGRRAKRAGAPAGGFTLIEVLIASLVLVVGVAAFFNSLNISVHTEASSRAREGATSLAREILEDARTIPYAQMAPSSIVRELQALPGLTSTSPAPTWTIARRGFTFTVKVNECSIDDPKDGLGKHDSTFCSFSNKEGKTDSTPIDFKQVSVDVTWPAKGRTPDVHQVETLTSAGETIGLSASNLHVISPMVKNPAAPVITASAVPELEFSVTAPEATAAMDWSLEGVRQSPQPVKKVGSTSEWVFSWKIPYPEVSDGSYLVTAQAIDSTGVEGPPVSMTVTLLRGTPTAPQGLVGGFNTVNAGGAMTRVIELQWQANSERNVIGYRVYGPSGLICPRNSAGEPSLTTLSLSLSCIDLHPPAYNASNVAYEVRALYHPASKLSPEEVNEKEVEQGPAAVLKVPSGEPTAPSAPASVTATKNEDGSVTLTWPKVEGAEFYRIYRGSTEYTSRYGTASEASFTDTDATTAHTYWVTAVSSSLTESPVAGPVTK